MHFEIGPDGMQSVRHGDHRRDADSPAHQHGFFGLFDQWKMIDRFGYENLAVLGKDSVHQL